MIEMIFSESSRLKWMVERVLLLDVSFSMRLNHPQTTTRTPIKPVAAALAANALPSHTTFAAEAAPSMINGPNKHESNA
jgi:hypothetical protein